MRHTYYTCDKCGKVMQKKGVTVAFFPICDKGAGFLPVEEPMDASFREDLELCEECCNRVFGEVYSEKE